MVKVMLISKSPTPGTQPRSQPWGRVERRGGESNAAGSPPWGGRGPSPERGKVSRHTLQALGRCGRLPWSHARPTAWGGARTGWGRPAL